MPRTLIKWTGANIQEVKTFTKNMVVISNRILFLRTPSGYKRVEAGEYIARTKSFEYHLVRSK